MAFGATPNAWRSTSIIEPCSRRALRAQTHAATLRPASSPAPNASLNQLAGVCVDSDHLALTGNPVRKSCTPDQGALRVPALPVFEVEANGRERFVVPGKELRAAVLQNNRQRFRAIQRDLEGVDRIAPRLTWEEI